MSGSQIDRILDYTAVVAAGIAGVKAVYAAGQGLYADPLRPGERIRAIPNDERFEEWSHVSYLPEAPGLEPISQEGTVDITWTIPMALILPRSPLLNVRALALPFYDAYLGAFWLDRTLGDLCQIAVITHFGHGRDGEDRWLDIALSVVEEVSY